MFAAAWLWALLLAPPAGAQPLRTDAGKFLIQIQELPIGTDAFTTDAEGGSESEIAYNQGGVQSRLHISIRAGTGRLKAIETDNDLGSRFVLSMERGAATLGIGQAGQKDLPVKVVQVPVRVFPYCTIAPEQLRLILAAYDLRQGGPQMFDVVYSNTSGASGLIMGKLTMTSAGSAPMAAGAGTIPVSRYHLSVPTPTGSLGAELFTGSDRRILMFRIASHALLVVREGFEALTRPEASTDPKLSAPSYALRIDRSVTMPMRDGAKLAADVYRPDAPGKFPVILQRTCYGRQNVVEASYYARRGYVFVAQDVRGKFDSDGEWRPWIHEALDGNDTIEWCARQKWSTGDVGMIGASYQGYVQWAAARENNKHLKCMIPIVSPPDPFYSMPYSYGSFALWDALQWSNRSEGRGSKDIEQAGNRDALNTLPVTDVDKVVFGHHIDFVQEWMQHPTNDTYWDEASFNDRMRDMPPIPALHVSGWFDDNGAGTKRNYQAMVASRHRNQKLVYGPWSRAINDGTWLGSLDFGPTSARDLDLLFLRWFDHWLKGIDNGIEKEPPVEAFMMGANAWRTFSAWPPKEAKPVRWYFRSGGHANSDDSDGTLSPERPSASEPSDRFTYDPLRPFGPTLRTNRPETRIDPATLDESAKNPDALTYTSAMMESDLAIAGPISVHLNAATSAKDTDWFACLEDVYPDGRCLALTHGNIQARFRRSLSEPALLKPGEIVDYTLDLQALGQVFQKGHRIRIRLSSSYFPIYARNLNTGENNLTGTQSVIAHQTIYHNSARPSYVMLQVLQR